MGNFWILVEGGKEVKDLRNFIKHTINDTEFWDAGGIPTKERYYIEKYKMTEEQVSRFYTAMCELQRLNKEINTIHEDG